MGKSDIVHHAYVISDLHLGGRFPSRPGDAGFRMMDRPDALAGFVRALASKPVTPRIELIINGDFLDFLAEETGDGQWTPFRAVPGEAVRAFEVLASRKEDGEVFDALAAFLDAGHRLTILAGNHDIELTLPEVREAFERRLWRSKKTPAFNVRMLLDGEALILGDALIEHGNRYDPANFVDHERLHRVRELRSRRLYGREKDVFFPPVGSRLVAELMNPIKKDYPFIDLLKPESEPLFALLLALDPSKREHILELAALLAKVPISPFAPAADPGYRQRVAGTVGAGDVVRRHVAGTRAVPAAAEEGGDEGQDGGEQLAELLARMIPGDDRSAAARSAARSVGLVLGEAPGEATREVTRGHVSAIARVKAWMSLIGLLGSPQEGDMNDRLPLLRSAVRALAGDQSFEESVETGKRYLRAARELAAGSQGAMAGAAQGANAGFKWVIFGHTHHRKEVVLAEEGGAMYLNTGTWANLMRFPEALLGDDDATAMDALKNFVASVKSRTFETEFVPTYVHVAVRESGLVDRAGLSVFNPGSGKVD